MVTSAQLRAARGLLNWTVRALAEAAGVHRNTVTRAETEESEHGHAVAQMVRTLEAAGVIFVAEGDDGAGVRLRKPVPTAKEVVEQIKELEAKASEIPEGGAPSPETGMNTLRRAVVENEIVALEGRRRQLKKKGAAK